jgi:hypothetical protein
MWGDFRPNDLEYYMEKHGISEDELKPRGEYDANKEVSAESATEAEPMPDRVGMVHTDAVRHLINNGLAKDYNSGSAIVSTFTHTGSNVVLKREVDDYVSKAKAAKPLTCTFCGETSSDESSFKKEHQIVSNGWCKSVVDAHNSLNPKFPINVQ